MSIDSDISHQGFEPAGTQIDLDSLKKSLQEGEQDIKAGDFKTHEEIKARFLGKKAPDSRLF